MKTGMGIKIKSCITSKKSALDASGSHFCFGMLLKVVGSGVCHRFPTAVPGLLLPGAAAPSESLQQNVRVLNCLIGRFENT